MDSFEKFSPFTLNNDSGNFKNLKKKTLMANIIKTSKFGENNLENDNKNDEEIIFEVPKHIKNKSLDEDLPKDSIIKNLKNI